MTGDAGAPTPPCADTPAAPDADASSVETLRSALRRAQTELETSRKTLRESREQLAAVIAHAAVGVAQIDLQGRFVLVNDHQCEILGRTREDLLSGAETMLEVTHPEDRPTNEVLLRRMFETGEPFAIEKRYVRPDGSVVWVNNHVSLNCDTEGRPRYITALVQDITTRRQAEAKLRERTEQLATVTNNTAEAIFLLDADGRVTFANPAAERMFGWSEAELAGRVLHEVIHQRCPDGHPLPAPECPLGRAISSSRRLAAHEDVFFHRDGSPIPVSYSNSTILSDGVVTGAVLVVHDVTTRRLAEAEREALMQQLDAERLRLAAILEHLPVGVGIVDLSGAIAVGNSALSRFLGNVVPSHEHGAQTRWIGRQPDGSLIEQHDFPSARALRGEVVFPGMEFLYRAPDGQEIWTQVAAVPVRAAAEGDRVTGAVILVEDIGERKSGERQRELLLAELNHRVKNILATVQSLAWQTLKGTDGDPARFAQHFGSRLKTLARAHDLLTERSWGPTGVGGVLRAALAPWLEGGGGAAARRFILMPGSEEADGSAGSAAVSPSQAQALVLGLHELATNATKYGALSRPSGRIRLGCERLAGDRVRITWTEEGGPPVPGPPARRGFGTRLLERGLARDLGPGSRVQLDFAPEGLRATVEFQQGAPLDHSTAVD